jgi:DNA-binding LacI/PurR family transcriptional regulator
MSRRSKTPLVLVGELGGEGSLPHVGIDNEAAAYAATAHLTALGKRRIAFIGAQADSGSRMAQMRRHGYEAALRAAGLPFDENLIAHTVAYHRADGASALESLLARGIAPDALFCATDLLALGALRAAHDAGLRVPDDLAIVGFDDIEEGRYAIPSLTTVSPDKRTIAQRAVLTLAAALEDEDEDEQETPRDAAEEMVSFQVIARESTAR